MSESTVRGKVHLIEATKTYGQSFRKRLVVLEQDKGRFTNYIPIEFVYEGCDKVDQLKVSDEIEVSYRLSGRRWQRDEQSEVKFVLTAEGLDFRMVNAGAAPAQAAKTVSDDDYDNYEADDDVAPF